MMPTKMTPNEMTPNKMARRKSIRVEPLTGDALSPHLDALSALRIEVFRAWPYLYDGDLAYERDYLAEFAANPGAIIVAAFDEDRMIGAATAAPLDGHTRAFVPLFEAHGLDPARIFYCGESVLAVPYRGLGLGHAFFDLREAHAHALNAAATTGGPNRQGTDGSASNASERHPKRSFSQSVFCGVIRDANDPRMPVGYRPLDPFWRKRGYQPIAGLVGTLGWREVNQATDGPDEIDHRMQFWAKAL